MMRVTMLLALFLSGLVTRALAFNFLFADRREQLKSDLLQLSRETKRGVEATSDQEKRIANLFGKLERLNPTKNPLQQSSLLNADWSLEYSTASGIIGKGGAPRIGPIVQTIDTKNLVAVNSEVVKYGNLFPVPREVTAQLIPQSSQLTNVQFKKFRVGPISFPAPENFKGTLDVTYLDEDLRLTRGDKGNLFVLTRMVE